MSAENVTENVQNESKQEDPTIDQPPVEATSPPETTQTSETTEVPDDSAHNVEASDNADVSQTNEESNKVDKPSEEDVQKEQEVIQEQVVDFTDTGESNKSDVSPAESSQPTTDEIVLSEKKVADESTKVTDESNLTETKQQESSSEQEHVVNEPDVKDPVPDVEREIENKVPDHMQVAIRQEWQVIEKETPAADDKVHSQEPITEPATPKKPSSTLVEEPITTDELVELETTAVENQPIHYDPRIKSPVTSSDQNMVKSLHEEVSDIVSDIEGPISTPSLDGAMKGIEPMPFHNDIAAKDPTEGFGEQTPIFKLEPEATFESKHSNNKSEYGTDDPDENSETIVQILRELTNNGDNETKPTDMKSEQLLDKTDFVSVVTNKKELEEYNKSHTSNAVNTIENQDLQLENLLLENSKHNSDIKRQEIVETMIVEDLDDIPHGGQDDGSTTADSEQHGRTTRSRNCSLSGTLHEEKRDNGELVQRNEEKVEKKSKSCNIL